MSSDNSNETLLLTVRLIRSFHHRNIKNHVIRNVSKSLTVAEFKKLINEDIKKSSLPPPFKNYSYDTLKIEHVPFKAKSNDPVINCEDDDLLILKDDSILGDCGLVNETEISYFVMSEYTEYKSNKYVQLN